MKEKKDCEFTDEIICPHCGFESTDSWEISNSSLIHCGACSKEFYVEVEHSTTYTTTCGFKKSDCDFIDQPSKAHPDYQECSRCGTHNFKRFTK